MKTLSAKALGRVLLVAAVGVLAAGGAAAIWTRRSLVVVTVRGSSMEPTFHDGDRVVVRRRTLETIRPGDIVVFDGKPDHLPVDARRVSDAQARWLGLPDDWAIKRATAVPGDPVPKAEVAALANVDHDIIPPGMLVVLGDNREVSYDSRRRGYVKGERLLGVVVRSISRASM